MKSCFLSFWRGLPLYWLLISLAGACLFFRAAPLVWPLAQLDYFADSEHMASQGRIVLKKAGCLLDEEWSYTSSVARQEGALDYVVRQLGASKVDSLQKAGVPLVFHRLLYKKSGKAEVYGVQWRPGFGALGWYRRIENDAPGDSLGALQALALAESGLAATLPRVWEKKRWVLAEQGSRRQEKRYDHWFLFEQEISPGFRRQLRVTVAGSILVQAEQNLALPAAAGRMERVQDGGRDIFFYGAIAAMVCFGILALRKTVQGLQQGLARPAIAGKAVLAVGLCLVAAYALDGPRLFAEWDPLVPRAVSVLGSVMRRLAYDLPMLLLLFALVLAGDLVERERGWTRGYQLWDFLNGRWLSPGLGGAMLRGYAIAFMAGALMVGANWGFMALGGLVQVQPQGFFSYALNSSSPGLSTLVFFLNIALLEEMGYRLFAQSYLSAAWPGWRGRLVAVLLPSLVFGAIHAPMYFLPPLEPWWGRVAIMAGIGIWWSLAAWRYGLLTVVIAHWASDLFIFNWPRIHAGGLEASQAILVVALPGLCGLLAWGLGHRKSV